MCLADLRDYIRRKRGVDRMRNFLGVAKSRTRLTICHGMKYLYPRQALDPRLFVQLEAKFITTGKFPTRGWGIARSCFSVT